MLEPNHTHFILVDDDGQELGIEAKTRNQLIAKTRNQLINKIATWKIGEDVTNATIPAVYLLLGGDVTIFETLADAANNNIPIVVFPESKGAAEVLVEILDAHERIDQKQFGKEAVKILIRKLHLTEDTAVHQFNGQIQSVIERRHLIKIYLPKQKKDNGTILTVLMQASMVTTTELMPAIRCMESAPQGLDDSAVVTKSVKRSYADGYTGSDEASTTTRALPVTSMMSQAPPTDMEEEFITEGELEVEPPSRMCSPSMVTTRELMPAKDELRCMESAPQGLDDSAVVTKSGSDEVKQQHGPDDSETDKILRRQYEDMHRAVTGNQIHTAKSNFDENSVIWQNLDLVKKLLHIALVNDQHKFVKFFIVVGRIDVGKVLTNDQLKKLYNEIDNRSVVFKILEEMKENETNSDNKFSLEDVDRLMKELIFDTYTTHRDEPAKHPYKELFLWAVLQDRIPMAMVFWKLGKLSMGGALVALKLLRELSNRQEEIDAKKAANMKQHAEKFEQMAVDILDMCYEDDRRRTSELLARVMPEWGGATGLDIAAAAKSKLFISQVGVQSLLSELWMGRLFITTHTFRIFLCLLFPFFSTFLITFCAENDTSVPLKRKKGRVPAKTSGNSNGMAQNDRNCGYGGELDELWWYEKLKLFMEAPVVCFSYDAISHMAFLVLFSYIMLSNFHPEVSVFEIVLMFMVFTKFTEELRQILQEEYNTLLHRFQAWLLGWNIVDLISLVMFAVGVGLRFHPATFAAARIVLALDLMVFYLRILNICYASKLLGPKLIMITRMMVDLISFVCILLVFLIAYGVTCQAIFYPNSTDPESIAKGVLYRSYFQLYGELFLDGYDNCATDETQLEGGMVSCPQHSWFSTVSLVFYLFISNILLINLLIAMLNYTFTAVQENTDAYWKIQRYQLIKEYYRRPALVSPFILLVHMYQLVRYLVERFSECKLYRVPNLMKRNFQPKVMAELLAFAKLKCQDYLTDLKEKKVDKKKKKMAKIEKNLSMKATQKQVEEIKKELEALSSRMKRNQILSENCDVGKEVTTRTRCDKKKATRPQTAYE
ncbi:transient receptor potential cation channel subfamily M member 5-like [Patiria miniata]|uniref:Uncharacterized protein n=1 Tax=Patiria miniata TaxID=46514 RepID=A0A914AKS9_PATMI|nr:transient receptor potential cation channel subfamily M member 5-like [Patiria miniata]